MIELPEAHILSAQLNETVVGKTILQVTVDASPHKFAWYSGDSAAYRLMLVGKKITAVNAGTGHTCGGNIEIICEDMLLVISTPIRFHAKGESLPKKHQLLIEFSDDDALSCTVQMWGAMLCTSLSCVEIPSYKVNKAPTPLDPNFTREYFFELLSSCKQSLSAKAFLATEQRIPGLGNGVLQDILFNASIHPKRKLESLSENEKEVLFESTVDTITQMVKNGGRDTERDLFGSHGGYKTKLSAKTIAKPCPNCLGTFVRQAYLGGNVYFCPSCQKI